uniref:CUB domain-containing protein n=1 Tax=Clastoptera arizonana TaxID=38151 RepID=A0A1B6CSC1_9HEMI
MVKYILIYVVCSVSHLLSVESVPETQNNIKPKCLQTITINKFSNNITSPNYPEQYPTGCVWEWVVNATGKNRLIVAVESFNINHEKNDQLSIEVYAGNESTTKKIVTENERELKIYWEESELEIQVKFLFETVERYEKENFTGFSFHYLLTTPEVNNSVFTKEQNTNTLINTTARNIEQYDIKSNTNTAFIVLYLKGKSKTQFSEDTFKTFLNGLAAAFCKSQNITLNNSGDVPVVINSIEMCPQDWPNSDICISVNVSIPISINELSTPQLYAMWATHSAEQLMSDLDVKEYTSEENNLVLVLWLATTGTLFLLFLAIFAVVLRTQIVENYIKRTRREHLTSYGIYERSRFHQSNQQQLVPPFFYPDERVIIDTKNDPQSVSFHKNSLRGQENPSFVPDNGRKKVMKQVSQDVIDDFDSDDDTIYPPSPLTKQTSNRTQEISVSRTTDELETAF